ncbi:CoB--CoM heterodisulfide reductase subunit B [Methanococcoides sp. NM1]|uniref:CoB--CoM heterodisulfide reductase subunit B n=1 Tax=Methanococcoides sp. NM1 TaxID=1201013 RepID=UPI001083FD6E|nr:CoB--CoM heterodisulfide reductase subunit B [Methanococcoides sp. NM1]
MTNVSLFLGCVIPNRYPGIEKSTKLCLDKLGVDCIDLEGASCCPAPGVLRSFDKATWLALSSRNIALSEELDRDLLTICNGCYGSLADANYEIKADEQVKKEVNSHLDLIGRNVKGSHDVRHITEFLHKEVGPGKIRDVISRPLELRVAVHYGCHLLKPSKGRVGSSVERPSFFDELVEATGAESVEYPDKMECCGAGGGVRSALPDEALALTGHKLSMIESVGVDCIVNACPFCHMQLDAGQVDLNERDGASHNIPVLHYTQLLGLALGFSVEDLGIDLNETRNSEFFEKFV